VGINVVTIPDVRILNAERLLVVGGSRDGSSFPSARGFLFCKGQRTGRAMRSSSKLRRWGNGNDARERVPIPGAWFGVPSLDIKGI
jgi:hypothetical protein